MTFIRGRPWRYSVIPSIPDFQTEYQICRHSNPAGIPVFAAIWGPGFRPCIIILTHILKQIKQMRITSMTMFKVNTSQPNEERKSVSNDAELESLLYCVFSSWLLQCLGLCGWKVRLLTSKLDNCNEVGSHEAHISTASCLNNPGERNDVLVGSVRVQNV